MYFSISLITASKWQTGNLDSDKASVDMQDIEQRLLSRFKWGLSAELHQPDYETTEFLS
jgi:chromosomal replication initiation ATPase DnaA